MLHMLGGLFAQTAGRLMAHGGENVGGFVVFGKIACDCIFQGFQISGHLQVLQALVNFRQLLRQLFRLNAVFARHAHQFAHTAFLCGQLIRIDIAATGHIAHIGTDFTQLGLNTCQHIQAFGKARFNVLQIAQQFLALVDLTLDAVVAVYTVAHLLGGLQQLGRMRQTVVALA